MNFAPRPSAAFAAAFQEHMDQAIQAHEDAKRAEYIASSPTALRPAIGAGRLGNECLRAIAYEYHRTPKDPGREFDGKLYRIFDRGHLAEAKMVEYLERAGFTVLTLNAKGRQFRFDVAKYEDGKGRIKGMIDGVITKGPDFIIANGQHFPMKYPSLWENKELGDKGWKDLSRSGLRAYGGDYFSQTQLNMFYMDLHENPALFTAKNANTQEIYAEQVPADALAIQKASDRGAMVVATAHPEEMSRIAASRTDYRCKFCDFTERCWSDRNIAKQSGQAPSWMGGAGGQ